MGPVFNSAFSDKLVKIGAKECATCKINNIETKNTTVLTLTVPGANVHAREFKLRLGFSSYDEQVTRNWHRQ